MSSYQFLVATEFLGSNLAQKVSCRQLFYYFLTEQSSVIVSATNLFMYFIENIAVFWHNGSIDKKLKFKEVLS